MKVAAAIQNTIQRYPVFYDKEKGAATQVLLGHFFPREQIELNPARNQNLCHQHQVKIAACPPSPTVDDPSVLPSPTSFPSSSQ